MAFYRFFFVNILQATIFIMSEWKDFLWTKPVYHFHMLNNRSLDFFQSAYLESFTVNVRLIYTQITCVCWKIAIEMSYSPLFHEILLIFA